MWPLWENKCCTKRALVWNSMGIPVAPLALLHPRITDTRLGCSGSAAVTPSFPLLPCIKLPSTCTIYWFLFQSDVLQFYAEVNKHINHSKWFFGVNRPLILEIFILHPTFKTCNLPVLKLPINSHNSALVTCTAYNSYNFVQIQWAPFFPHL